MAIQRARAVERPVPSGGAVGIDMGTVRFATLSNGEVLEPLDSFKRHEGLLRRAQQAKSRKQKHGKNRNKAKARWAVQRLYATLLAMNAHIYQELQQLSPAEKRSLGEALIVSADSEASAPDISDEQRAELRSRLAFHRANPDEIGVTFAQLKANILSASTAK